MVTALARRGMFVVILVASSACDDARPVIAPTSMPQPTTSSPVPVYVPPVFPPLTGPSATYTFSAPLGYPVHDYTATSKVELYENGAAAFHFSLPNLSTMPGKYSAENGRLAFLFKESGAAEGTLRGDALEIRWEMRMQMADYEDAVYQRTHSN